MSDRGTTVVVEAIAIIAIFAVPLAHGMVGAETLAISDAKFGAVMILAGTLVSAIGAAVVAWVQGRKTRASHSSDHGDTRMFITEQLSGLRGHIDGRFDHIDARLDSHDVRITRVENRP